MSEEFDRLVERINALWHKKKTEGLTPEEEAEQKAVREEYLSRVRASLRAQMEGIRYTGKREPGASEQGDPGE
ncbi:MAG TPA: DUF896 domain-containing protein [Candidatus Mcinerneyibacteriales bacterium]|nr:DUF896 domain-containing protein [Candidatus Mcinerneyibacteriales bacterium]